MPKRVYLQQLNIIRKAGVHTAYVGTNPNGSPIVQPGQPAELLSLQFVGGVARDVDERVFERFRDAGVATVNKPRIPSPYDEDDDEPVRSA